MKNVINFAGAIFIVAILASCKAPYFNSANNMKLINGSVIKNNGEKMEGQISVDLENYRPSKLYVTITPRNSKQSQRINITDIKGINIRNNYYQPVLIDMGGFGKNDQLRFLKRLTKDSSRIHMYELHQQVRRQNNSRYNNSTYTESEYSYYIVTPQHTRQMPAWDIEGRRLIPNFEDKMSEIVKDCPSLSEKIKNKEKGYFYAQISLIESKKIETVMGIIEEYNGCSK